MSTPTDAEAALHSTDEKANFHRLIRLLMCGGVSLLREKFDSFHSPTDLPSRLSDPAIINQLRGARLSRLEWDCLYPSRGTFGKSVDFDITLTFRLLRTICNLTEPLTGWNGLPNSSDHSLEADLVRIKYYRNSVYGHNQTMEITDSVFRDLWKEISEALLRIAGSINNEKKDEWKKAVLVENQVHSPMGSSRCRMKQKEPNRNKVNKTKKATHKQNNKQTRKIKRQALSNPKTSSCPAWNYVSTICKVGGKLGLCAPVP